MATLSNLQSLIFRPFPFSSALDCITKLRVRKGTQSQKLLCLELHLESQERRATSERGGDTLEPAIIYYQSPLPFSSAPEPEGESKCGSIPNYFNYRAAYNESYKRQALSGTASVQQILNEIILAVKVC